ncbi:MAG: DUF2029 domain-containing protein [Gemmataceae bacterium]|nr:DUF2029 domain-containing protein [Gemmataceae bacterium]
MINLSAIFLHFNAGNNDSVQYYIGARSLHLTGDPYRLSAEELGVESRHWAFCYPPGMACLFLPFAWLSLPAASWLWLSLNLLFSLLLAWQLARVLKANNLGKSALLGAVLLFASPPYLGGLLIGQCHAWIAILLAGAFLALSGETSLEKGQFSPRELLIRDSLAGLFLALAVLSKLFPGLLILALLLKKRWRPAAVAGAGVLLFLLLTADQHLEFYCKFIAANFYPTASAFNISLGGMGERLFHATPYAGPLTDSPALCLGFKVAVMGILAFWVGRWWFINRPGFASLYAAGLCLMLLGSPIAGFYHLNLAWLAAAIVFPTSAKGNLSRALLITGLALTWIPVDFSLGSDSPYAWQREAFQFLRNGWGLFLLTPQTYGVVLILAGILQGAKEKPGTKTEMGQGGLLA